MMIRSKYYAYINLPFNHLHFYVKSYMTNKMAMVAQFVFGVKHIIRGKAIAITYMYAAR